VIIADTEIIKILTEWLKRIFNIRKKSMWVGILCDRVLGLFFIDSNLTEKYENMLQDKIADNTDYHWFKF